MDKRGSSHMALMGCWHCVSCQKRLRQNSWLTKGHLETTFPGSWTQRPEQSAPSWKGRAAPSSSRVLASWRKKNWTWRSCYRTPKTGDPLVLLSQGGHVGSPRLTSRLSSFQAGGHAARAGAAAEEARRRAGSGEGADSHHKLLLPHPDQEESVHHARHARSHEHAGQLRQGASATPSSPLNVVLGGRFTDLCQSQWRCVLHPLPPPQVCVKDSTNIEGDSDVSLEIPPGTVIAYSVLELVIRQNGQFGEHIDIIERSQGFSFDFYSAIKYWELWRADTPSSVHQWRCTCRYMPAAWYHRGHRVTLHQNVLLGVSWCCRQPVSGGIAAFWRTPWFVPLYMPLAWFCTIRKWNTMEKSENFHFLFGIVLPLSARIKENNQLMIDW